MNVDNRAILDFVRKQYFFRPNGDRFDAWDIEHLIELSEDLVVKEIPLASIAELDAPYWFGVDDAAASVRILVRHMELVNAADLSYPVILGAQGQVMDGMHRIAKSLLLGRSTVRAVQFEHQPKPDHIHVTPDELPYD